MISFSAQPAKTSFQSYLSLGAINACAAIIAFCASAAVTHAVSPDQYGHFVIYLSLVSLGALVFISWPNAASMRYGREEWTREARLRRTTTSRIIIYALGFSIAALFTWIFQKPISSFIGANNTIYLLVIAGLLCVPLSEAAIYLANAASRFLCAGYAPLASKTIFLCGCLTIIGLGLHASWIVIALIHLAGMAVAAGIVIANIPPSACIPLTYNKENMLRILRYSWIIPLGSISAYIVAWVDTLIINKLLGTTPAGVYTWAYQLIALGSTAFTPIVSIFSPAMVDAKTGGDSNRYYRHARRGIRCMFMLSVCLVAALPLVSPSMHLFGNTYRNAYSSLLILACGIPLQFINYWITPIGSAQDTFMPKFVGISFIVAGVKIVGDFALIPLLGISGAAWTTIAAFATGSFGTLWMLQKYVADAKTIAKKSLLIPSAIAPCAAYLLLALPPVKGALAVILLAALLFAIGRSRRWFLSYQEFSPVYTLLPQALRRPLVAACRALFPPYSN